MSEETDEFEQDELTEHQKNNEHVGAEIAENINYIDTEKSNEDQHGDTNKSQEINAMSNDNKTENLVRSAIDATTVNMMICNSDFEIVYANEAVLNMFRNREEVLARRFPGFKADELIGRCIDVFHVDPSRQRHALAAAKAGAKVDGEITIENITLEIKGTSMFDDGGNFEGAVVEWNDITEKRKSENEMLRLKTAIDSTTVNLMICDKDFNVVYANQSVLAMLTYRQDTLAKRFPGFKADELIGRNIDVFHVNPAHQRHVLDQAKDGRLVEGAIVIDDVTFEIKGTSMVDSKGNFAGSVVEWNDITEELKLQQEMLRLKSAIDGSDINLMMCDENFKIVYANDAVLSMFRHREIQLQKRFPGFKADALIGTCIDDFHVHPPHQRDVLEHAKGKVVSGSLNLEGIELEIKGTSIYDNDGVFTGSVVEWKDVTDQKFAEAQVERLINSVTDGDFSQRIDDSALSGFMQDLSSKVNQLVDVISKPISSLKDSLQLMASGDLTVSLDGDYKGDLKEMQDAFNGTLNKLLTVVTEVNQATGSISTASAEISEGNTDLSQRTESQASSLEETASSMEEMTATVKQNADNAGQANTLAAGARDLAEQGGQVVRQAVKAMNEISMSSRKISDIISVIDEIAFQTNLLALNAAVEAARAGEQGKGFAVVAGEVRSLAQRSAGAAKEIKSLIQDSGEKVKEGSRLVDTSGETLDEVVAAFSKVNDIISEISAASQEQSLGITQVNKAISSMDEMTQQNAGLVEEAAAAAQSLNEQAQGLRDVMSFFETGETYKDPRDQRREAVGSMNKAAPAAPAAQSTHQSSGKITPSQSSDKNSSDDEWSEF